MEGGDDDNSDNQLARVAASGIYDDVSVCPAPDTFAYMLTTLGWPCRCSSTSIWGPREQQQESRHNSDKVWRLALRVQGLRRA